MQVYSFTGIIKYHPDNGFVFLSLHTSEKKFNLQKHLKGWNLQLQKIN